MKKLHIILFLFGFQWAYGQVELKQVESPIFGSNQISKVVKQYDGAQKVVLTVEYANISTEEAHQIKAFIATGGKNPMRDIKVVTQDLNSASGNLDFTFTFTPQGRYNVAEVNSHFVVFSIAKKQEGGGLMEDINKILGDDSSSGNAGMDIFSEKYVYRLKKSWMVVGTLDKPDALSAIVVPVKLIPLKSAQFIQP